MLHHQKKLDSMGKVMSRPSFGLDLYPYYQVKVTLPELTRRMTMYIIDALTHFKNEQNIHIKVCRTPYKSACVRQQLAIIISIKEKCKRKVRMESCSITKRRIFWEKKREARYDVKIDRVQENYTKIRINRP